MNNGAINKWFSDLQTEIVNVIETNTEFDELKSREVNLIFDRYKFFLHKLIVTELNIISEYCIVSAVNLDKFVTLINTKIKEGWVIYGEHKTHISNIGICVIEQAMVR